MIELASYVEGKWVKGKGKAAELVNPATEQVLATTSTDGVDFAAALAYARDRGGPALRAMSFAQRGEMLRAMSRALHAKRAALLLSAAITWFADYVAWKDYGGSADSMPYSSLQPIAKCNVG